MITRVIIRNFFMLCLVLPLSWSCSLFSRERAVSLRLPRLPEDLESSFRGQWKLHIAEEGRPPYEKTMDWGRGTPPAINLSCSREKEIFVLLYPPHLKNGQGFHPMGICLSPEDREGKLDFKDGAAVFFLSLLVREGVGMEGFNSSRFIDEMRTLDDTWLVDREKLLLNLSRHVMRSSYIREKPSFKLSLNFPAGVWYRGNLSLPPIKALLNQKVELELPRGCHLFYCPENALIAEVQVDDHGRAVIYLQS